LRDDGITYHEYISEISLILFFRLANILGVESEIPERYRWNRLRAMHEPELLVTYQDALHSLADSRDYQIAGIFRGSSTSLRSGLPLSRLIEGIDGIDWQRIASSSVGDIYESLIAKNAQESRYGSGQYFTPRAVVEAMVEVTKPQSGENVFDPAAGTAGFLVAAGLYTSKGDGKQCALTGNELVPEVSRLARMNLYLHGLKSDVQPLDSLSEDPRDRQYEVCLTNPPFGIRGDLSAYRNFTLQIPTNNKQLGFLQHIYSGLREQGSRAAVVVPDNVLFESGAAAAIRTHLLDNFNLHTILRLPTGIFYATGVRTSVLFFARTHPTDNIWVYDLRRAGGFTKKRPLEIGNLRHFIECYGDDPFGDSKREETPDFTAYERQSLRGLDDRLDINSTISDGGSSGSPTTALELIAAELESASAAVRELQELLSRVGTVD
jgi:type I restriction enzyme M protein